jgi:hypothetical protein
MKVIIVSDEEQRAIEDTRRRTLLNQERNPRETILYEGSSTLASIDPITGETIDKFGRPAGELDKELYIIDSRIVFEGNKPRGYMGRRFQNDFDSPDEAPLPTNNFIESQFALARMDVKRGRKNDGTPYNVTDYKSDRELATELVRRMNEAYIPLVLVSNADGLDDTLKKMGSQSMTGAVQSAVSIISKLPYSSVNQTPTPVH